MTTTQQELGNLVNKQEEYAKFIIMSIETLIKQHEPQHNFIHHNIHISDEDKQKKITGRSIWFGSPLHYLIRHSIELFLKMGISVCESQNGKLGEFPKVHDLNTLSTYFVGSYTKHKKSIYQKILDHKNDNLIKYTSHTEAMEKNYNDILKIVNTGDISQKIKEYDYFIQYKMFEGVSGKTIPQDKNNTHTRYVHSNFTYETMTEITVADIKEMRNKFHNIQRFHRDMMRVFLEYYEIRTDFFASCFQ